MNLVNILEESAKNFSWRNALVSEKESLSFQVLNKRANQLSFGLRERLGLKKGEKVAILLNNCPEFIVALFAILKAGAICVPLNVFLTFNELEYIMENSNTKLLISSSEDS